MAEMQQRVSMGYRTGGCEAGGVLLLAVAGGWGGSVGVGVVGGCRMR